MGEVAGPMAVIGMAGRFPLAMNITEYWENLVRGRDCISSISDEDLIRRGERPETFSRPDYVRRRPRMPQADMFDPRCFGITPREAELRDPQQRVLLEIVHAAIEHAGYDPARYGGAIGVFAGTNTNRYRMDHIEATPEVVRRAGFLPVEISNASDYVATFISYRLGLRGPGVTVQTACSTSVTALHTAAVALHMGDCDLAVAAAASIEMPLDCGYLYVEGDILASDGTPRPFDEDADGTNFGSGAGAVLLKPLADALRDRDTIYAVLLGSALNNDGDRKTAFTQPSAAGQADCIAEAIRRAGVDPSAISYVEMHATGTKVGDPIEIAGLNDAFRRTASGPLQPGSCDIGSVKANVGHAGPAAGVCGLIKTVLALVHERIPPSINVAKVNHRLNLEQTSFVVTTATKPWPRRPDSPRIAGVSSFGIGGTNAHAILREAPLPAPRDWAPPDHQLIVWSGAEPAAVDAYASDLAAHFTAAPADEFPDAAYTLRVGRTQRRFRAAMVADSAAEAAKRMRDPKAIIRPDGVARDVVFCFPGQGAQHVGMAWRLYETEPRFREICDEAFDLSRPLTEVDLLGLWRSPQTDHTALSDTVAAQSLLFIVEYALARCLLDWGVTPARLVGHSVGELVAATVAGVFSVADGLRAVAIRARLMREMAPGGMLAVAAGVDVVDRLEDVYVAAVNGDRQTVLSGAEDALIAAADKLRADGVASSRLGATLAFHSPSMRPAAEAFEAVVASIQLSPPALPLISCATGIEMTDAQACDPAFWARQIVAPVLFSPAVAEVLRRGPAFLVEVGPGQTLAALLKANGAVRGSESVVLATQPAAGSRREQDALERTLGRLWVEGHPVDLAARDARTQARRVAVPGYPYQRQRYWIDRPETVRADRVSADLTGRQAPSAPRDALAHIDDRPLSTTGSASGAVDDPSGPTPDPSWSFGAVDWVRRGGGRPAGGDGLAGGAAAVVVLPDDPVLSNVVRGAFQRAGYRTVRAAAAALDGTDARQWDELIGRADDWGGASVVALTTPLALPESVGLADLDDQLEVGLHTVLEWLRAAARAQRRLRRPLTLVLLTRYSVDITGAETVNPVAAMASALLRTAEQEYAGLRGVLVDVAPGTPEDVLSHELSTLADATVALRGTSTWTPVLRTTDPSAQVGRPRLRRDGVYLVTGGLGGLGLVVAKALAETGRRPRLVLLGRSGDRDDGTARARQLEDLRSAGASVLALQADVSDPESLRAAVDRAEREFGHVNGIVHAAGVAGGGLIERRGRAETDAVLAAKVRGTLVLDDVFAGRPTLDFLVLFSSLSSLAGMLGSADYAAANAFLNAFATAHGRGDRWTVSVCWPGWSEVGMLAAAPSDVVALFGSGPSVDATRPAQAEHRALPARAPQPPGTTTADSVQYRRVIEKDTDWVLDEHRFDGIPVLPGTSSIEFVLTAARSLGLVPADRSVELREITFVAPVVADVATELTATFTTLAGVHRVRVESRPVNSDQPGQVHVTGVVGVGSSGSDPIDLNVLVSRLTPADPVRPDGWIQFGPRWGVTTEVWVGQQETLTVLSLPDAFLGDLAEHPAHPALLDCAGIAADIYCGTEGGAHYLPFMYREASFFGPIPAKVLAHTRAVTTKNGLRSIDVDIYDAATAVHLVRIRSYLARQVQPRKFVDQLTAQIEVGQAPSSRALPAPTSGATPGAPALGVVPPGGGPGSSPRRPDAEAIALLSPADGAVAFLAVLDGTPPPVVLVNAPGARLPIVGMPWTSGVPVADAGASTPALAAGHGDGPTFNGPTGAAPILPLPQVRTDADGAAGNNDVVSVLQSMFSEALGIDPVGLDEDFFDIGGDSLTAVQLIARVRDRFGVDLSAGVLFAASSVRQLADELASLGVR